MRILLVDDEQDILELMAVFLERKGNVVTRASDGASATEIIQEYPFDLVITDMIMPVMSGMEVIRHVRAHAPETRIIAISGGGKVLADNYLEEAQSAGADAVVRKPFTMNEFFESVMSVMNP